MNDKSLMALPTERDALLPSAATLQTMLTIAEQLFKSDLMPTTIKSAAAVLAVMQKGIELGIPPMHALSNIAVISGKPTCNAELMLALIYRDHGDDAIRFQETSADRCVVSYKRRGWQDRATYAFTRQDATTAGLSGSNWSKYPAAMLRARCVSAVARMAFPDTIGGMYTPEELGAPVDEEGHVLVVESPTNQRLSPSGQRSDQETQVPVEAVRVDTATGEILDGETRPAPVLSNEQHGRRGDWRAAALRVSHEIKRAERADVPWPQERLDEWTREQYGLVGSANLTAAQLQALAAAIHASVPVEVEELPFDRQPEKTGSPGPDVAAE